MSFCTFFSLVCPHKLHIYIHEHFCCKILSVFLYCINMETHLRYLFKSLYISTLGLFFARRHRRRVMSKDGHVGNSSKTFQAVNARCIFSDFMIWKDTRSWINKQAYNDSLRVSLDYMILICTSLLGFT